MTTELAQRAVACKRWKWLPGMSISDGLLHDRICTAWEDGKLEVRDMYIHDASEWLPDLADPATLGCLLALVREAWQDPMAFVFPVPAERKYAIRCTQPGQYGSYYEGKSEVDVLVKALEDAP